MILCVPLYSSIVFYYKHQVVALFLSLLFIQFLSHSPPSLFIVHGFLYPYFLFRMKYQAALISSFFALAAAAPTPFSNSELNAIILAIETKLPVINGTITEVSSLITSSELELAALTGTSTTQNGLSGPCKELTVIFARGT